MSEIISDFAEETYVLAKTIEHKKRVIDAAVLFWNLLIMLAILLDTKFEQEIINKVADKLSEYDSNDGDKFSEMFGYYTERKKLMFPDVTRMVINYEAKIDRHGKLSLSVFSTEASLSDLSSVIN